ncbi:MAG: GRP family sugar transporter [Elusimicrobiota bacterium]|nr:GRP family sugar transporter [Elusimicrobiota bacterium]
MNWFTYALGATFIYGIINFLYKVGAECGFRSFHLVNIQSVTVAVLAFAVLLLSGSQFPDTGTVLFYAGINSFFWALGTSCKISAMKHIPANIAMPLNKLNSVFVMLIGIIFFADRPSLRQAAGMVMAVITLIMLSQKNAVVKTARDDSKSHRQGVIYILVAAVAIALSMTTGKLAAMNVEKLPYIFFSYLMAATYTFGARKFFLRSEKPLNSNKKTKLVLLGISLGVLNITGYYMMLKAWSTGPLSLVQGIISLTMIISILLSSLFYREKFTPRIAVALVLSMLAAFLIRG